MNRVNFNGPVCAVNLATGDHSKQNIRKLSDRELRFLVALAEFRKREVEEGLRTKPRPACADSLSRWTICKACKAPKTRTMARNVVAWAV